MASFVAPGWWDCVSQWRCVWALIWVFLRGVTAKEEKATVMDLAEVERTGEMVEDDAGGREEKRLTGDHLGQGIHGDIFVFHFQETGVEDL